MTTLHLHVYTCTEAHANKVCHTSTKIRLQTYNTWGHKNHVLCYDKLIHMCTYEYIQLANNSKNLFRRSNCMNIQNIYINKQEARLFSKIEKYNEAITLVDKSMNVIKY